MIPSTRQTKRAVKAWDTRFPGTVSLVDNHGVARSSRIDPQMKAHMNALAEIAKLRAQVTRQARIIARLKDRQIPKGSWIEREHT